MMTSIGPSFSPHPGAMQQHPGVPPGHHMAPGMAHNPSQPGAQPGAMPHQLHMGVSAPGGQVNPAALMGGMPPGGPNAHAMQHLNPQVGHMFQGQQMPMNFNNPQLQHLQQQRLQQLQAQQQQTRLMAQQMYGQMNGMPMAMGGMPHMTQMAQMQAMRSGMRAPVALPPHLQQAQLAQHGQQQAHNPQAQQAILAQQLVIQQQQQAAAAAAAANQQMGGQGQNPNQPGQMSQGHPLSLQQQAQLQAMQAQQAQQAAAAQQQAQQQQAQQQQPQQPQPQQPQQQPGQPQQSTPQQGGQGVPQPNAAPQNQGQPQGPNSAQANQQQQAQQASPAQAPQNPAQAAHLLVAQQQANSMMQAHKRENMKGHCLLRLMQFAEHLSATRKDSDLKGRDDMSYWTAFVQRFFSQKGSFRYGLQNMDVDGKETLDKQYEITYPALPRFFHTQFVSGVKCMQLTLAQGTTDRPLPGDYHFIENNQASFIFWFEGSHVVQRGTLRAQFDAEQKIEVLEFNTTSHEEYVSRRMVIEAAKPAHNWVKDWKRLNSQDTKQSPEMSKKGKTRPMKSPQSQPPDLDLPQSAVKQSFGVTEAVHQLLEMIEMMDTMKPVIGYAHAHPNLSAYQALEEYVAHINNSVPNVNGQPAPAGSRTPNFAQFPMGASPHAAQLQLPGSPHVGSPAAGAMQAPGMQMQQSQQGTSSSGPSANTSPAGTKRRRPSGVKEEDTPGNVPTPQAAGNVVAHVNGVQASKAKPPTPRMQKRLKGNPQ